jgi:hypothetical protein
MEEKLIKRFLSQTRERLKLKKSNVKKKECERHYDAQNHIHKEIILLEVIKFSLLRIEIKVLIEEPKIKRINQRVKI